jgi:hypothetical protein
MEKIKSIMDGLYNVFRLQGFSEFYCCYFTYKFDAICTAAKLNIDELVFLIMQCETTAKANDIINRMAVTYQTYSPKFSLEILDKSNTVCIKYQKEFIQDKYPANLIKELMESFLDAIEPEEADSFDYFEDKIKKILEAI